MYTIKLLSWKFFKMNINKYLQFTKRKTLLSCFYPPFVWCYKAYNPSFIFEWKFSSSASFWSLLIGFALSHSSSWDSFLLHFSPLPPLPPLLLSCFLVILMLLIVHLFCRTNSIVIGWISLTSTSCSTSLSFWSIWLLTSCEWSD